MKPYPSRITQLIGLACISLTTAVQAQVTGTNQIAFSDFDNTTPPWNYGYFYDFGFPAPPVPGTYEINAAYSDPDLVTGPLCFRYGFSNSPYELPLQATPTAGYGTGFGFPLNWGFDPSVFNSTNLTDYIFTFKARVLGLSNGVTSANCEMQCQIYAGGKILQKNFGYVATSNWTEYTFTLDDGSFADGTTYASFIANMASISDVRANNNNHMPHDAFGWDGDNVITVDNLYLGVIQYAGPPAPPPPTYPVEIVYWNFDDRPFWWGSGGWGWSATVNPSGNYAFGTNAAGNLGAPNTFGVDGSSGWVLWMTNSQFSGNVPAWCGIGMNGAAGGNYAMFNSSNLTDYRFTVDARVGGLADGQTESSVNVKVFLRAPDDTLQPPDGNTDEDTILALVYPVTVTSNWQTFSATLNAGGASDGTSKANFPPHYNQISSVMAQAQVENLQNETMWGYDSDNVVYLDNYRVDRMNVGLMGLTIQQLGNDQVIAWPAPPTGSAKLLTGPSLSTVTNEVVGATSPYTNALPGAVRYFRSEWVAP